MFYLIILFMSKLTSPLSYIVFLNQACVCSAYIPVYCGLIPPTLQGVVSKINIIQHLCTFHSVSNILFGLMKINDFHDLL